MRGGGEAEIQKQKRPRVNQRGAAQQGVQGCTPSYRAGPKAWSTRALQPLPALCLPHEPQLQTVHTPATLHHLVSRVQSHVVELVLLEGVAGLGPVTALEQVLRRVVGDSQDSPATELPSRAALGDFLAQSMCFFP